MGRLRAKMRETGAGLVALAPGSHMEWLVGFIRIPTSRGAAADWHGEGGAISH
jgi:hypothetical protein